MEFAEKRYDISRDAYRSVNGLEALSYFTGELYVGTLRAVLPSVSTHDARRATQVTLRLVVLLASVLFVVFAISFVFSDRGLPELQHARTRVAELRADIARLENENARLRAEIESVKKSSYAIERIAREDLGMSKKGEVIYMLPKK